MKKMSVILPVYNEGYQLAKTINSSLEFLKKNPDYEFIFVNDGSTDNTQEIIRESIKKAKIQRIKLISYKKNQGKGFAVKTGVLNSQGDFICFIDSDLAYSLEHLNLLTKKLENFDVVIGSRRLAENPHTVKPLRKLIGRAFNILSRLILNLNFKDMQAGLKGFRKQTAKQIFKKQKIKDFSFDVEILFIANKNQYTIGQIPAKVSIYHKNQQSSVNLIKDSIKMFFDLFKIRLNYIMGKYG